MPWIDDCSTLCASSCHGRFLNHIFWPARRWMRSMKTVYLFVFCILLFVFIFYKSVLAGCCYFIMPHFHGRVFSSIVFWSTCQNTTITIIFSAVCLREIASLRFLFGYTKNNKITSKIIFLSIPARCLWVTRRTRESGKCMRLRQVIAIRLGLV